MIAMSLRIIAVLLSLLVVCRAYAPAPNPPMLTHASMDVGNIISIVIPESPDENVNVEQLTGEFRQQLERIKKQSRASKVEHGLVTLKRVLPEMSREEKRKTLPLIRRVLHGRRVANAGPFRNWTREAARRAEQAREGGQFARSRLAGNRDERIYRDYEEHGNREAVTTRVDHSGRDDFRRINAERTYDVRREETPREDPGRRSDQDEMIRREDRRDDRVIAFPNEDPASSKIPRSGSTQEWNGPNWVEQPQVDARNYPETSTADCNYKFDRVARQKEPGNEILQNDRYEKVGRQPEVRVDVPDERNVDYVKLDQQIPAGYAFAKQDSVDNARRNSKDARGFEVNDTPGSSNYPGELDVNGALNPDCDTVKKNSSGHSLKEHEGVWDVPFDKQRQEASSFERENRRVPQRIIQDPREQSERSNATGFENTVNEGSDSYAPKTKRGHSNYMDYRGLRTMKSNPVNRMERWNMPAYDERHLVNSSDVVKVPPNVFGTFSEKDINSGLAYVQTEQADLRSNLDNEPKMAASLQFANYGNGRHLRIQRSANGTHFGNATTEVPINVTQISRVEHVQRTKESLFERLKHLFKPPSMKNIVYTGVVLLYDNKSEELDERTSKTSTETGKSQGTDSPSMTEPTSSTSHGVSIVTSTTMDLPAIWTTEDLVTKPQDPSGSF